MGRRVCVEVEGTPPDPYHVENVSFLLSDVSPSSQCVFLSFFVECCVVASPAWRFFLIMSDVTVYVGDGRRSTFASFGTDLVEFW